MARPQRSLLRRLLIRVPIPVLALLFGLLAGGAAWYAIDRIQTRALAEIFDQELESQLLQQARVGLIRFDQYRDTYAAVIRLLANHRHLSDYLAPVIWAADDEVQLVSYRTGPPPWLPDTDLWRGGIRPSHILLVDTAGRIREAYHLSDEPIPRDLLGDAHPLTLGGERTAFMTRLDGRPYLIASDLAEDPGHHILGSLVLLVPIDSAFLAASQHAVGSDAAVVAILDSDARHVLASSDEINVRPGDNVDRLSAGYVVTAQSFFDYEGSDLNMLFATLVPRAGVEATGARVLDLERRQRLIGAGVLILVFVALFIVVSGRINRLLQRMSKFSRRALDMEQPAIERGNQLLILEEWIHDFAALVMHAREETRARHEEEMRESEALTAALMETSLDSIITVDEHGRIIEFNPTAAQTFGYDRDAMLGRQFDRILLARQSRSAFLQRFDDCSALGPAEVDPRRFELRAKNREGQEFPVELAIKPTPLHDRLLFTVYVHDISERKRQEAEIKSLAAIPSESPIPVLRVNRPGVVIYANGPSEPLLRHWGCHRLQTLPVYWKQQVQSVLDDGRTRELEVHTDHGIYSLLFAPIGELDYVNIYARDITKVREAEEEARRRQNELVHVARLSTMGEMATGIAHELNQPLSAIVNFANGSARRLELRVGSSEDLLHALAQITLQARRAGEIIKRLRGMVSRQQPVRRLVDLNALARETCAMVAHETRKLEVTLELALAREELLIRADPVQIEQVLLNLIRNALDALAEMPVPDRRLALSSGSLEGERVYLSVEDHGKGIRPDVMEHLFEPFFTTKSAGMGMGLAITQTIVNDHHGKIRADSWPGRGSVFTLELPAAAAMIKSAAS
ncbi:MAG: PAS domain S-box protein [Gammaproteobacteria bacterium]|jgi:two-component system sensor kinase FixL